ncbi:hypothetical protein [Micromonospora sp. NPDC048839]
MLLGTAVMLTGICTDTTPLTITGLVWMGIALGMWLSKPAVRR